MCSGHEGKYSFVVHGFDQVLVSPAGCGFPDVFLDGWPNRCDRFFWKHGSRLGGCSIDDGIVVYPLRNGSDGSNKCGFIDFDGSLFCNVNHVQVDFCCSGVGKGNLLLGRTPFRIADQCSSRNPGNGVFLPVCNMFEFEVVDEVLSAGRKVVGIQAKASHTEFRLTQLFNSRIGLPFHDQHPFAQMVDGYSRRWFCQQQISNLFWRKLVGGRLLCHCKQTDEEQRQTA